MASVLLILLCHWVPEGGTHTALSGWSSGPDCRSWQRDDVPCVPGTCSCTVPCAGTLALVLSPSGTGKSLSQGAGWAQQNQRVCLMLSPLALLCSCLQGIHLGLWLFPRSHAQLITIILVVTGEILNISSEMSFQWVTAGSLPLSAFANRSKKYVSKMITARIWLQSASQIGTQRAFHLLCD